MQEECVFMTLIVV